MFNWFFKKAKNDDVEKIKDDVKGSFDHVKKDIDKLSQWVTHLNNNDVGINSRLKDLNEDVSTLKDEIEQLKEVIAMFSDGVNKQVFKATNSQKNGRLDKQTAVDVDENAVQTPVQTGNFYGISNLSATEKAIIWVLVNSELKLSYDDLAAMLGKTKSTIRGQINSIKQKSEGLVLESVETNGMKRVYIPEEMREKLLKKVKVRVKKEKKAQKTT